MNPSWDLRNKAGSPRNAQDNLKPPLHDPLGNIRPIASGYIAIVVAMYPLHQMIITDALMPCSRFSVGRTQQNH